MWTTMYHKTLETSWHIKELVGKLKVEAEKERAKRKLEIEIQLRAISQCISGIELLLKSLTNIEKLEDCQIRDMNTIFSSYLKYIGNVDIKLRDKKVEPSRLRKYRVCEVIDKGVQPLDAPEAPTTIPMEVPNAGLEETSTP